MAPLASRPVGLIHPSPPAGLSPDRVIRWFAARQHGVVARRQLLRAGMTGREIDGRVARGALARVHRGVVADGGAPLTHRGRLLAALLAAPPDAVVSHRSAAELRGLLPESAGPVHVTTGGCLRSRRDFEVHRSRSHARVATILDGIPCTSLPRTLVDVSASDGPLVLRRAWTTAAGRRALRPSAIEGELRRSGRRAGSPAVRALLERHREATLGVTRSGLEDAALAMCVEQGLPMPRVNAVVRTDDGTYEADLLWAAPRVVVELDDWTTHGNVEAFHVDRDRDFDLDLTGWRTLRLVRRDVTTDALRTADRLDRFFAMRLTELGRRW
jgi:hypothetical protein